MRHDTLLFDLWVKTRRGVSGDTGIVLSGRGYRVRSVR